MMNKKTALKAIKIGLSQIDTRGLRRLLNHLNIRGSKVIMDGAIYDSRKGYG